MSEGLAPGATNKPDFRAAVNAVDDWIDDNAASFNSALPEPYKSDATAIQKADLLATILTFRTGRSQ